MKIAKHSPRMSAHVELKDGSMRGCLHLYDAVGGWDGIRAKDVVEKLQELKAGGAQHLDVHINSPGGSVWEGTAIHTAIAGWDKGQKIVHIDGLAASIGSLIAMAGDEIHIAPAAMMMVHPPSDWAMGTSDEIRQVADKLDAIYDSMVDVYVKRTGLAKDEVEKLVDATTWLTAKDAVAKGFADKIVDRDDEEEPDEDTEEEQEEDRAAARFRSSLIANAPAGAAKLLAMDFPRASARPLTTPAAPPPAITQEDALTFDEYRKQQEADAKTIAELKDGVTSAEKPVADLLAVTGQKSAGEALAVVTALKETAAKVPELQAEIAKRDAEAKKQAEERQATEIKAMLDEAGKDGRLTPAKRQEIDAGSNAGLKAIVSSPVTLKAYLDSLTKAVATTGSGPAEKPAGQAPATAGAELSAEDKKVIEQLNLDPILYALEKSDPSGRLVAEERERRKLEAEAAAKKVAAEKK